MMAQSDATNTDPTLLAVFLTTVLEHSTHTMTSAGVGAVKQAILECEQGTVVARWINVDRTHLVAALLDPTGNLGLVKLRMQELLPTIASLLPH